MTRQPRFFIPHGGGPCFFMPDPQGNWTSMAEFLRGLPARLPEPPKAILVVSGHWETEGFAFTGALGAALALGARRGGLLIAVVVLPLFIPPVVFGAGALERATSGQPVGPALALLTAYVLFAAVVTPFAGAAAIRNAQG